MKKILGLDLGIGSIGWSIIEDKKIIDAGVRIFEPCTEAKTGALKNAKRRTYRLGRRQKHNHRIRKIKLLRLLIDSAMCPLTHNELDLWLDDKKQFPQNNEAFNQWLRLNPYILRYEAVNGNITKEQLGRIFYHLSQRRGFLSSRKIKEDGKIFKGKEGNTGIDSTNKAIANYKTLGEYLYSIFPKQNQSYKKLEERIRARYTTRQMYLDEFDKIWQKQQKHLGLSEELREKLRGKADTSAKKSLLFYQKELKSQKSLIRKCQFEKDHFKFENDKKILIKRGKRVSPKSHPDFEEYRMYKFLNSIKYQEKLLDNSEKDEIQRQVFAKNKKDFKFEKITKKLTTYNPLFFNYEKDFSISTNFTINNLKGFFKDNCWDKYKYDIWHCFYTYDDNKKLCEKLDKLCKKFEDFELNYTNKESKEKLLDKIKKFNLKDDYANLSLKAIRNILLFLKKGIPEHQAVFLGGVYAVLIKKNHQFTEKDEKQILAIAQENGNYAGKKIEKIKKYLIQEKGLEKDDKDFSCLYHPNQEVVSHEKQKNIPPIDDLRNPVVQQAVSELRKLVNRLLNNDHQFDQINIELAREIKLNKKQKKQASKNNKENKTKNDEAKEKIQEHNLKVSRDSIQLYRCFDELREHRCPYTGKMINISSLFNNSVELEHIIPRSISFNDSLGNKTICMTTFNSLKSNKTPYQFWQETEKMGKTNLWGDDIQSWQNVKDRAFKILPYRKAKHFCNEEEPELDKFISRNLNDTRYISKKTKEILSIICDNIMVCSGSTTAMLRRMWGLDNFAYTEGILTSDEKITDKKIRQDHLHHLVDSIVVSATSNESLQIVHKYFKAKEEQQETMQISLPWKNLRNDLKKTLSEVFISHRKANPPKGQLHKENFYGKHNNQFYITKNIADLKNNNIEQIIDPVIKNILKKWLEEKQTTTPTIPNSNGDPVPINKVRIIKNSSTAIQISNDVNRWVETGSNHHIVIYQDNQNKIKEEVVSLWEVNKRLIKKEPIIQSPSDCSQILYCLQKNDMYLLGLDKEQISKAKKDNDNQLLAKHLYRVQKLSKNDYYFRYHCHALKKDTEKKMLKRLRCQSFIKKTPQKVTLTIDGKITIRDD